MATISQRVKEDFDRIFNFLFEHAPDYANARIEAIISAVDILEISPLIGRPVALVQRELVMATGANACLALYRHDPVRDAVFVATA